MFSSFSRHKGQLYHKKLPASAVESTISGEEHVLCLLIIAVDDISVLLEAWHRYTDVLYYWVPAP